MMPQRCHLVYAMTTVSRGNRACWSRALLSALRGAARHGACRPGGQCPGCGSRLHVASRAPLFVVTGASCSGKTAILAPLAAALAADCVTFDADVLMDAAGALSRDQPIDWPAFHAAWLAVAHGVAQSGLPTVLLAPIGPGSPESLPARRRIGDIRYLVLDCPDDVRRQRMAARPRWRLHDVEEQVNWAAGFGRTCRTVSTRPAARQQMPRQRSPPGCYATSRRPRRFSWTELPAAVLLSEW
jgi:hypothetical protein